MGRFRATVLRDGNALLRNVAPRTSLISAHLDNIARALPVEGKVDTANARSGEQAETFGDTTCLSRSQLLYNRS